MFRFLIIWLTVPFVLGAVGIVMLGAFVLACSAFGFVSASIRRLLGA